MESKEILVVASNYGVWAEELQAPWDALRQAGHRLTLATPMGKKPLPLAVSVDPDFVDPVQAYHVNPPEVCERAKQLVAGAEWDNPVALRDTSMQNFDALVMAGGLGADLDLANNPAVHRLILEAVAADKLVCAMCFAVAALVFTRDPATHRSIVYGKKITAHPRDWDFTDDVSYELFDASPDNNGTDLMTPGFVLPLQDLATDAGGPEGQCSSDPGTSRSKPSVVFDWPLITACSVESSIAYGNMIVEVLAKTAAAKATA